MKLIALVFAVFLALAFFSQSSVMHAQQKPEELAQTAAESWLALTDSGKYGESWEQASTAFRGAVSKDTWVTQLTNVRTPLGKMESRKLANATYRKDPPNAPVGEYVVLHYHTDFENGKGVVETVAVVLDKDGKWRATGYFIK